MQRCRVIGREERSGRNAAICKPSAKAASRKRKLSKLTGGGGGQRAYISERLAEERRNLAEVGVAGRLNAEYKRLSPAAKEG